ncbi:MAG TPA: phenylalanine--tRNA ligase subunit beta [Caulobacteraceae bacterium]|nr:phenylalanine--tRNA ligase subunit beta [Caulobacteraceae bacterium]
MKITLSWLADHLQGGTSLGRIVDTMTMIGMEVEHVIEPGKRLAAFSVAKVVWARPHPNADRLSVCTAETRDGVKEIVCGAPNARAGLTTIYAPVGAVIPATGMTLEARPVRGVVSSGMLCSARELEAGEEAGGIIELADDLAVGAPAAEALGLEAVIDFEATPNRPDWLGVAGVARDLAAAGLGRLISAPPATVAGGFTQPIDIRLPAPEACPAFAGRLIRGVKNSPSPAWLQQRLISIGLRPINALADITNFITHDRARPLHVYDAKTLAGGWIEARLGRPGERLRALDGRTYDIGPEMCVIADASGAIGLGGVMGGASTGCSEATTEVFIESAWFDPIRTAQTGRATGIVSDAQYRFARGVDPASLPAGIEQATAMILEICGGEPSEATLAGRPPPGPAAIDFDPAYVRRLGGLEVAPERSRAILEALGFEIGGHWRVRPPSWRGDVEGKADLVEEVTRIAGYDAIPAEPLPAMARPAAGMLTPRQARIRTARRAMAALGYQEAVTWSFIGRDQARAFGGGAAALVIENPIASDLDCMRPSALPGLALAAERNARRGFADAALFEIGPVFAGNEPGDQRAVVAAVRTPARRRRWDGLATEAVFELKSDLLALLEEVGAPAAQLRVDQSALSPWWRPGRGAALRLGKTVLAEFGELHPAALKALGREDPLIAFELALEAIPEPRRKATKGRPPARLSPFMPLTRDFAFVVDASVPAGDLARAVQGADRELIGEVGVFDVYIGEGLGVGEKSVALEVRLEPRRATLSDKEIEAVSERVVAAAAKAVGARLRGA